MPKKVAFFPEKSTSPEKVEFEPAKTTLLPEIVSESLALKLPDIVISDELERLALERNSTSPCKVIEPEVAVTSFEKDDVPSTDREPTVRELIHDVILPPIVTAEFEVIVPFAVKFPERFNE